MAAGVTHRRSGDDLHRPDVEVGADTVIHPGVTLEGDDDDRRRLRNPQRRRASSTRRSATTSPSSTTASSSTRTVADGRRQSGRSRICAAQVDVARGAKVGNFVELKKTVARRRLEVDAPRLSRRRHDRRERQHRRRHDHLQLRRREEAPRPTIEDGAFIGSDTQLIAPVTVGKGAYVGTGTTIREDVPAGALAVSAGKQRNIEGWVEKKKEEARVDYGVLSRGSETHSS